MSDTKSETYLRMGDVTRRLGVTRETVVRIVERGELKATKVGTWLRFKPADVEAYLKACELN